MKLEDINLTLDQIRQLRDECRPTMDAVIDVLEDAIVELRLAGIMDCNPVSEGPDTWSWVDRTDQGHEKWFVLTGSHSDEAPGYPVLTIRSTTSPRLDSAITTSGMIMGPTREDIAKNLGIAVMNHNGAYGGYRETVVAVMELGGTAEAAIEHLRRTSGLTDEQLGLDDGPGPKAEDMN